MQTRTDANSTAYAYPLIDAEIGSQEDWPAVVVPLVGTTYDLATGKLLERCS